MPTPTLSDLLAILYLIFLEGVLSVDNALALAALVRGKLRHEEDRKKALRYGIIGAYVFRVIVIFAGVWLMEHAWVKWLAAAYLVYLGTKELLFKADIEDEPVDLGIEAPKEMRNKWHISPLWGTVIAVELMDITFSVDSIAVALSVSKVAWVLIAGAIFGILAMRFAAQGFIKLMEKFPVLEKTAFVLVIMAGFKIIAELKGVAIPEVAFMGTMFGVIGVSMLLGWMQNLGK